MFVNAGPLHGGANEAVMHLIKDMKSVADAESQVSIFYMQLNMFLFIFFLPLVITFALQDISASQIKATNYGLWSSYLQSSFVNITITP